MRWANGWRWAGIGACAALAAGASAQAPAEYKKRPIEGVRITTPPVIDGDLSDEAWNASAKADTFVDRVTGAPVDDQTTAYIAFDEKYIYVAFRCRDSQPDRIMARETIRDHKYANRNSDDSPNKEDNVTFSIDPFFTQKATEVSVFSVNAIGTRSAAIAGGRGGKVEWKGDWDAAAKRQPDGYTVEMRIPWDIVTHPSGASPCTMGIDFFRFQNRNKVESAWSNVGTKGFYEDAGQWTGVVVPSRAFRPKLSLLPYVLPGVKDERGTFRSGVDARLALTPELTAVGSLNPDFNTIEGAVEGIQFSRRERFVPEKRPFFLEGEDFFVSSTRFNDIGALFYARRIGSFDVGTKLYGKLSPVDSIGYLNATTFGERTDTVIRYKRDLDASTSAGVFLSNRTATDDDNSTAVVDFHRRKGAWGIEGQLGKTWGQDAGGGLTVLSTTYEDKSNSSILQYQSISDDFRVANGFVPYTNQKGFFGFTDWFSQYRKSKWRNTDFGFWGLYMDHQDGSAYSHGTGAFGSITHTNDWRVGGEVEYSETDGTIDSTYRLSLRTGATNRFRQFGVAVTTGRLQSEPATFVSPSASLRLLKKLDVSYGGSILNLQGQTNQHVMTASYELSPTRSIGGRVVTQNADTNWYVSFRSSGAKGTEFYFIIGDPNARRFVRQAQLKVVFAF
ncbi:MAG: sugar-binding protein [Fimbriimonadales bacterium]